MIAANQLVPLPVTIRALVDTGASITAIDPAALKGLGLTPTGKILIHTPSTDGKPHTCNQYDVRLGLVHPTVSTHFDPIPIIESRLSSQGIQPLLGRDILDDCLLVYNGTDNRFTISF